MSLSKLLTTMINRVQGIDYLIFSIVARGREREWRRGWNNRRRIAPISIFFSFFSSTFRLSRIFFLPFLPLFLSLFVLSILSSPRCCFRSRIFRQQGLVLFRRRATLIVNSTVLFFFFFFPSRAHRGQWWISTIHGKWKCIFRAFSYTRDKRDTRFRFGETMGRGRGQRTFCYCFQLDFFTGRVDLIYSRGEVSFFYFYLNSNRDSGDFGIRGR